MTDAIERLADFARGRRVALVHDWLNGMRGGEKVLEHVVALFPDADLFTLVHEPKRLSPALRRMRVRESRWAARFPAARRHYRKLLPLMPRAVAEFPTDRYDLMLATSHCVAKGARPPRRGTAMAYVFSPMRYVWDHFEDYLTGNPLRDAPLRLLRGRLQRWDRASSQGLDAIAADSAHIAAKIERFWGRRADVILPPVDLDLFTPDPEGRPPGDHFLVVAALVPYKRVDRAVEAATLAGKRLVVVGDGPERDRLRAMAGPGIEFRGWVPDEELRAEYRRCAALLYPGTEDFGITALEAQACGRPVIAFAEGGATETVVDGTTGEFFHRPHAEALAERLSAFRPEEWDQTRIRRHAERFSPRAFRDALAGWILREVEVRC